MVGVTFGTKHSYDDFGLILTSKDISLPVPKTDSVNVEGMNGELDLTEVLTDDVKFKNRKLTFTFTMIQPISHWQTIISNVTNYLHGKKLRIILDADQSFCYEGRCAVDKFKSNKRLGTLVVEVNADPYKTEINSTSSPWIWDSFNFTSGIIYINNVVVAGSKTINLLNRRKIVSPTFIATAPMQVSCNRISVTIPKGTTTVLAIRLQEGNNYVTFKGTGTVTIDYKGGAL